MNFNLFFASILILSLFISCNENKDSENKTTTPQSLTENSDLDFSSSLSKRYSKDIIQQLYNEALEKDSSLNVLNKQIYTLEKEKDDSIVPFNKYVNNNLQYWNTVENYISRIQDSVLREIVKTRYKTLEEEYKLLMRSQTSANDSLINKIRNLHDCELLLQLSVSNKLMKLYQKNELPDNNTILHLVQRYDTMINRIDNFVK